ncbi:hypothetical protein MRB53_008916 [Persea americana]|uniref:Uncharacterized protein n=1 Tax=Persea americana TaxID=3435 RepID=A0ACC2LNM7_PERAE|nr:hypothetical protein MRB53_008916 [Persea americana]
MVRASHWELPLAWDFELEKYARWWAGQREGDCKLQHSFPEDDFKLGENVFWGSGSGWTPTDAVRAWADEVKYYTYATNTCQEDQMCGHYTQIVWSSTRRLGCARVVCDDGDTFMTCNYDPPDGLPEGYELKRGIEEELEFFLRATPGNYREALKREGELRVERCVPLVCGGDGRGDGVPWVAFWIGVACSLLVHLCTDLIRQMIGTQPHEVSSRLDESLSIIPGCSQFQVRDLPEGIVVGPLDSPLFKSLHRMSQELPRAAAILVNDIEEMDPTPILDHLGTIIKKCLPVGPLSHLAPTRPDSDSDPRSCLPWLESKAPASVAYVGFGTMLVPPPSELAALAEGLEASGAHFLWSLKDEHRESLPAGFLDRTRGRGLVVPWTPQTRVLAHVAVGAFINHCGWNSVLEGIMEGVPMMCRPFFGDERVNARVLSHVLGIAAEIKGGVLTREGVMDGLDLLLREEGKKMREKVGSLKQIGRNAVSQTGSTTKNLKTLLEIIKGSA